MMRGDVMTVWAGNADGVRSIGRGIATQATIRHVTAGNQLLRAGGHRNSAEFVTEGRDMFTLFRFECT